MTKFVSRWLLAGALAWAGTFPAWAHAQEQPAEVVRLSGDANFPRAAAGYVRGELHTFRMLSLDFAYGYDRYDAQLQNAATIYVYAGNSDDIARQFEHEKQQIEAAHGDAQRSGESTVGFAKRGQSHPGRVARYRYEGVFAGQQQVLYSELILIRIEDRYVKVRSTAPIGQASLAQESVRQLLEAVDWAPASNASEARPANEAGAPGRP